MYKINKRGQSASSETSGWILALLVLIVVALVVWGFFSYFKSGIGLAPDQIAAGASYCENSIYSDNPAVYCGGDYKPYKVGGKDAYYTCYDIGNLVSPRPEWMKTYPDCSQNSNLSAANKCYLLNLSGDLLDSNPSYISRLTCSYDRAKGNLTLDGQQVTHNATGTYLDNVLVA